MNSPDKPSTPIRKPEEEISILVQIQAHIEIIKKDLDKLTKEFLGRAVKIPESDQLEIQQNETLETIKFCEAKLVELYEAVKTLEDAQK